MLKDKYLNNFSKSQVTVAHSFWVICRVLHAQYLCRALYGGAILVYRFGPPIWPPEINKNIWSSLFYKKPFLFTRELAYARIIISFNTWNGYTAEIKRRDFFQRGSIPILVSRTVKTREFKLLYFRNESCYGNGNLYKDLFFVYLQLYLV